MPAIKSESSGRAIGRQPPGRLRFIANQGILANPCKGVNLSSLRPRGFVSEFLFSI